MSKEVIEEITEEEVKEYFRGRQTDTTLFTMTVALWSLLNDVATIKEIKEDIYLERERKKGVKK